MKNFLNARETVPILLEISECNVCSIGKNDDNTKSKSHKVLLAIYPRETETQIYNKVGIFVRLQKSLMNNDLF